VRKDYADIPEGQISYLTEGRGETILLLHQTPSSFREYSLMIPELSKKHHVIAMETLGYGYSDNPPREYEIEDFARSVASFLDALGVEKTNIVGHHTGAVIAVEIAANYPERVEKLVVSGLPLWEPEKWEQFFKEMESMVRAPAEDGLFLTDLWNMIKSFAPNSNLETLLKSLALNIDGFTRLYDSHQALPRYNLKQRLPLIKAPTLLISGRDDVGLDQLEPVRNLIPRCKTLIIEDAGALICYEKPREFAQAIIEWLSPISAGNTI